MSEDIQANHPTTFVGEGASLAGRKHHLSRSDFDLASHNSSEVVGPEPKRIRGGGISVDGFFEDEEVPDDLYDTEIKEEPEEEEDPASNDADATPNDDDDGGAVLPDDQSARWSRLPVPPSALDSSLSDLNLQWLDIDSYAGSPLKRNPNPHTKKMPGASSGEVPVIRIFGVTESGNSVCAHIHGFTPYGYFALPEGYEMDSAVGNLEKIRMVLNDRLRKKARSGDDAGGDSCHWVEYTSVHRSIMGYKTPHTRFLKVYVAMPTMVPTLKRIMEEGIGLPGVRGKSDGSVGAGWEEGQGGEPRYQPFECNVPFVLRFMIDQDITGAGWLTLPKGTYAMRDGGENKKQTHCQLEVDVACNEIVPQKPEGEWNKIAPLRVLSVDIECQGRKGHFPEAEKDPVIQIANVVSVYGQKDPISQAVFTLGGCLPIVGAQIIPSDSEEDMLLKWRDFLQKVDPDILTGYNVQNFDIPYLLDRADALATGSKGAASKLRTFRRWGRIRCASAKMREAVFSSAAYGRRANVETTVHGRVIFDMLPYMQRNHKLSSYSLNSVCAEFLSQQKEDVHHSIISDLQNGTDEDRRRLASYCLKDAQLPQRLMDKLSVLVNYVEMARVTGVPVSFLITRGQQIKVFSMILRKCRDEKLLVPTLSSSRAGAGTTYDGYEGGTVLEPIKNFYTDPIATLDFASLYPSIAQAYNLCYSTLVSPADVPSLDPRQYEKSKDGHVFVRSQVKKGILPTILEELLSARKRAKQDMKKAPTAFEKAVQNGRQLALKISANSVYGFTGAGAGQLPCLPIASSVTSYGRSLLERTKEYVEENFTIANGYKRNAQVIYGDTDSVMVNFGTTEVDETFQLAVEAAEKCSAIFPDPILLEFEKVYHPYLLMNKKRYAGLLWTNPKKHDYMDTKGLETVRRDNCALVREVIQTSLDKILIERDVDGAVGYVKSQISDLLQNKMDISRLVITKSLNKGAEYALGLPGGKKEDYKVKQAHVELAARMRKRDPGSAPQMGDRVPYVITTGTKGAANFEKAEDPVFVLENNIPIDCKWYLTNQLSKPLARIFEPIIGDVENCLLRGDHTRKIFIPTPTARKGSLMMFAVKKATCLGCKTSIDLKEGPLCRYCVCREREIYLEKLAVLREAELRYARLWAQAQRVHGTVHTDIMCTGDGCACQIYRRKKVQADIRLAQEVMDRFGR